MRRDSILRRLLTRYALACFVFLCGFLACVPMAQAQSVTTIDGSQTNLVIVGLGNSASGWIAWRSKFIPSHVIIAYELTANFTAVNPIVKCSMDDQSGGINPNDSTKWFQIALNEPGGPGGNGVGFDVAGPSVGTVAQPAGVVIIETGVFPCVAWAIQPAGNNNTFQGVSGGPLASTKITAVQLPSSGDASFLLSTAAGTLFTSGANRTTGSQSVPGTPASPGTVTQPAVTGPMLDNVSGTSADGGFKRADSGIAAPLGVQEYAIVSGAPQAATRIRICQNATSQTAIGAATVQLLTGGGAGQNTKICGVIFSNTNATATTATLISGTGTTCGTGTATIIPPITLSANTGSAPNFSFVSVYPIWTSGGGQNLNICVTGSAAGSVNALILFEAD